MSRNNKREIKYYKFELGNTIVMEKDGLWYQRDQENHEWILNNNWMARYFDAQYDVIEIDYDESEEFDYTPRTLPGFFSVTQEKLIASVKDKDESENNCPYEYSEGMPSKGFGLPKELAAVLPNPDRIIITSFSSAGNTFGTRKRFGFGMNGMNDIYKAQNFIQYRCKQSKNSVQAQNCTSLFADSFHPFVQRYANDISGCVENILHSIMYTPISYELTDGILNVCLDSGYQETYYQETSEYIRYNDRYQESFHDGGGNGFEEWYVYAASITEYKTEISDVIGYKHFSALPSVSLPYCRGFWTEDGHVYLVDPWGLSGIFEFYYYSEGRPDAFSEEKIENVGTPYKKQT